MQTLPNGTKIEWWFEHEGAESPSFSEYWNDESQEQAKPFDIKDGNLSKLEDYLESSVLRDDLDLCLRHATDALDKPVAIAGNGIDLACGNLWATAHILKTQPKVETMTCVDFSLHRLTKLGPKVIDAYKIPAHKVTLAHGSFYDIKRDASSFDFAVLSQAFHHADDPLRLLGEIRRVLKPNGIVIISGEHLLNEKLPKPKTDPVLGDHFYFQREYQDLFDKSGFRVKRAKNPHSVMQAFILSPRPSPKT